MYIDPGLGSMILQAVVALFAMAGVVFYAFRSKIMGALKKKGATMPKDRKNENSKPDFDAFEADDE